MTETWDEIEAPLRERVGRVAEWVRERIAEDRYVANDVEDKGEWHSARHDTCPLVLVDVVTADETGALDEILADDVRRSNGVHMARHDPVRVLGQCDALEDALTELEKLADRAEHPDARAGARAVIMSLAGIWGDQDEIDAIYLGGEEPAWAVVSDSWLSRDPRTGEMTGGVRNYPDDQPDQHTAEQEQQ